MSRAVQRTEREKIAAEGSHCAAATVPCGARLWLWSSCARLAIGVRLSRSNSYHCAALHCTALDCAVNQHSHPHCCRHWPLANGSNGPMGKVAPKARGNQHQQQCNDNNKDKKKHGGGQGGGSEEEANDQFGRASFWPWLFSSLSSLSSRVLINT